MPDKQRGRRVPLTLAVSAPVSGAARPRAPRPRNDWSTLMARAQDGDRGAYRALLEEMTPYLRSLAARCFDDPPDVEDAVQDVLLAIHLVRNTYNPARPFGPWLVAIANRRIIDRLRRKAREKSRRMALAAAHETFAADVANFQDDRPTAALDDGVLRQAMARLSSDQRQAVELLKLKEMSLKEAAAVSGRSVAALKVATHRAIKNLRAILQRASDEQ